MYFIFPHTSNVADQPDMDDCNKTHKQLMEVYLIIAYIISNHRCKFSYHVLQHSECHTLVFIFRLLRTQSLLQRRTNRACQRIQTLLEGSVRVECLLLQVNKQPVE